jgi:hypothetical protein
MEFPMASTFGSTHIYVLVKFAQNTTHLFVYIDWEDVQIEGSDSQRYSNADGVAILWNAHPGEYDLKDGWFGGMKTDNAGESVDVWAWKAAAADVGKDTPLNLTAGDSTPLVGNTYDTSFDNAGWNDTGDSSQDVSTGAAWGNLASHHEENYGVEFSRPLVTADNDGSDVQFDQHGYYEFAIALWNGTSGSSHIMSFEHSVFVYGACTSGCDATNYVTAATIGATQYTYQTVTTVESTTVPTTVPTTEYVPTTIVNNNTIVETSTEAGTPLNAWMFVISLFSMGVMVRLISKKK